MYQLCVFKHETVVCRVAYWNMTLLPTEQWVQRHFEVAFEFSQTHIIPTFRKIFLNQSLCLRCFISHMTRNWKCLQEIAILNLFKNLIQSDNDPITLHCYMAQQLHSCHNSLKLENLRLPFTRFWQKESSSCFMASMRKGLKTWLFSDILAFHKYWQANSWQSSK